VKRKRLGSLERVRRDGEGGEMGWGEVLMWCEGGEGSAGWGIEEG